MVSKVIKTILILGLLLLAGWLLYRSSTIILYILVSIVVAMIARPIMVVLQKIRIRGRRIGNSVRAGISLFVVLGLIALIIGLFLPVIIKELRLISQIDLTAVQEKTAPFISKFNEYAEKFNLNESGEIQNKDILGFALRSVKLSHLPGIFNSVLGVFGNILIAIFSIAFISFFLLKDNDRMNRLVISVTPFSLESDVMRIMTNTRITLSRYFIGLLIQIVAISTTVFIGLSILGVQNALLIAVFTGIVNLVPYLGPWIGALFGVFIVISNNINASYSDVIEPTLIGLLIVFAITQLIDNYVYQPTIFSNSIHAHPLEIFLVILVAGTIGGVGGMIAAIPVYAFLRIVFTEMDNEFGWLKRIKAR